MLSDWESIKEKRAAERREYAALSDVEKMESALCYRLERLLSGFWNATSSGTKAEDWAKSEAKSLIRCGWRNRRKNPR